MNILKKLGLTVFVISIVFSIMACQEGSISSEENSISIDESTEITTNKTEIRTIPPEISTVPAENSTDLLESTTSMQTPTTETGNESVTYTIDNDISTSLSMYRFDGNFIEPEYHPFIGNLTFTLEINDEDYRNSTYFVVTRDLNSPNYDFLQAFTINGSHITRFHSIDYSPGKEVIVAKIEGRIYNNLVYLEPVASLVVTDSMESSRKTLPAYSIIGNSLRDIDLNETPYLDLTITATDPERIISSIKTLVYYSEYGIILDSKDFEISQDMYDEDELIIENIIFENLPPEKTFTIIYLISGNDGVDDFEEVQITTQRVTTSKYSVSSNIWSSYPGFWGAIHYIELYEDYTRVYLHYVNSQVMSIDDEYLTGSLNVYDDDGNRVKSYPLVDKMTYLDIPNEHLDDYYSLRIECDQEDDILAVYHIRYGFEGLDFITATYADQNLRVFYQDTWVEVISIYLKITQVGDGSNIIELTLSDLEEGYNDISYPQGPNGYFDQYDAYIEITFLGFNGEEVFVTGYSKR